VVLIGGSGPADRHNDGLFDSLRDHLVSAGVAVLSYDKRGVGGSTGTWAMATVDDLAGDAAAALERLRDQPGVSAGGVGLLGHSEGGWVALRVCANLANSTFLILNSCPAVSFIESEVFALTTSGVDDGVARTVFDQLLAAVQDGEGLGGAQRILEGHQSEPWYGALEGFELDDDSWAQMRAWCSYDPHDDLERLTTPTLAVFGELDPLVPIPSSLELYRRTAVQAKRLQRTLVFAGADHRIQTDGGFASGYLTTISEWCRNATE
jgi:pimeloyl-ACP methyl ester carboxylesterase